MGASLLMRRNAAALNPLGPGIPTSSRESPRRCTSCDRAASPLGDPRRLAFTLALAASASIANRTTFDPDQAGERMWITRLAISSLVLAPYAAMYGAPPLALSTAPLSHLSLPRNVPAPH